MGIEPVKRTRAYEDIVKQLAAMIQRGELKPGDRLPPERDLALAFGVGRPTLRQALTVLAQAGIIEVLPGLGVYLRKPVTEAPANAGHAMGMVLMTEKQNLFHIQELRVGIEGEAAYLAAKRRTPEHIEKLTAAYRALSDAFEQQGMAPTEDFQFHTAVAEATGNAVILKVMASLADLFIQQFKETSRHLLHESDRVQANVREHDEILRAIIDQRADDARAAMVRHLKRVLERLERTQSTAGSSTQR